MPNEPSFLDWFGEIARHGGEGHRLPHWEQDGRTYFVTFRLADALPHHLTAAWQEEHATWLRLHPEPWNARVETEYHRRFSDRADRWLDASLGSCSLRRQENARCIEDAMFRFDGIRCDQHAVVIMPNHVHALFSLRPGGELPRMVGAWKGVSARAINALEQETGTFWQKDYFDRLIRDAEHFWRCAAYVRWNPRRARLSDGEFLLRESTFVSSGLDLMMAS